MACVLLRVTFLDGQVVEYPCHEGGSWTYREDPTRIVVRPYGPGVPRHEIPLVNVRSMMLVEATPEPADEEVWTCQMCGTHAWVAASFNGGWTRIKQCVKCGHYSNDPVIPVTVA